MDIRTYCDPIWGTHWFAYDANTYDCDCDQDGFFSLCPMGEGKTPEEAIADLVAQLESGDDD